MSNDWIDGRARPFSSSWYIVDASTHVKYATLLCELLDGFIQEIGLLQHVVQVIMDDVASYVAADMFLMSRYPTLFWIPCVVHYIDLILEDIGKLDFIRETIESGKSITKFIYNHASTLSLMR